MFRSKKKCDCQKTSPEGLFELMKLYKINYYRDTNVEVRKDLHDIPVETKTFNPNPAQPDWGNIQEGLNV